MKLKNFIIIFIGVIAFASCEYETIKPEEIDLDNAPQLSFATDIQPILTSKCATCHSASYSLNLKSGASYNSMVSNGFIVAGKPAESTFVSAYDAKHGSENRLSASEKTKVQTWIAQGAKNN